MHAILQIMNIEQSLNLQNCHGCLWGSLGAVSQWLCLEGMTSRTKALQVHETEA
jgi:hypothetical protein